MASVRRLNIVLDVAVTAVTVAAVVVVSVASAHLGAEPRALSWTFWFTLLIGFASFPVVAGIERLLRPVVPRKSLKTWLLHYRLNMLLSMSFAVAGALSVMLITALNHHYGLGVIDLRFDAGHGPWAILGIFILSTLIYDFFYYWYHRSLHTFPVLWQIHKLHHMDPQMDVVTVGRQNWVEGFTHTFFAITVPALFFKLNQVDFLDAGVTGAAIGIFASCWGPFFHANVKLHLGKAAFLMNAPQLHRIHHSRLPQHQDKNFSNYFPVWDLLFGTYYRPDRDEYPPTGVEGEKEVDSLLEAELLTIRAWRRMFRDRRRRDSVRI
jgi:sterol desaturase/sphingolipid hydroxylase (fatty acid hydroxylase superfamily)